MLSLPVSDVTDSSKPATSALVPALRTVRDALAPKYQSDPGWFTNTPAGQASKVARWLFDDFFKDKPLPPPALVPFNGGQCQCDMYDVVSGVNYPNGSQSRGTRRLAGAILGLVPDPKPTPQQPAYVRWNLRYNVGCNGSPGIDTLVFAGEPNDGVAVLVSITKVSGADSCGSLAPRDRYTIAPPSVNININVPDIRVSPSANFVIPVVILRPNFNISPNISVSPEFNFSMPIDLGGQIVNFNGSEFNISNSNDYTDITNVINLNTNSSVSSAITNINNNTSTNISNSNTAVNNNTNTKITSAITSINTSTNTSITSSNTSINTAITNSTTSTNNSINNAATNINTSIFNLGVSLSAQIAALANLQANIRADIKLNFDLLGELVSRPECPEPVPLPPDLPPSPPETPPDDGGSGTKPKLSYLEITLTTLPTKAQYGNNGSEPVFFAGWVSFKYKSGAYGERIPVHFRRSIFAAPVGTDGYTYTLTNGAKGYASVYSF